MPVDPSVARRAKSKPGSRPAAFTPARKPAPSPAPTRMDSTALERAVTKEHAHWPLAVALARRSGNPDIAEAAAAALVHEAERMRLSPSLLGAVLLIENTPLDPTAVSSQGAIGLMQVMPVHRGNYGCSPDLVQVETNICHGASIQAHGAPDQIDATGIEAIQWMRAKQEHSPLPPLSRAGAPDGVASSP